MQSERKQVQEVMQVFQLYKISNKGKNHCESPQKQDNLYRTIYIRTSMIMEELECGISNLITTNWAIFIPSRAIPRPPLCGT